MLELMIVTFFNTTTGRLLLKSGCLVISFRNIVRLLDWCLSLLKFNYIDGNIFTSFEKDDIFGGGKSFNHIVFRSLNIRSVTIKLLTELIHGGYNIMNNIQSPRCSLFILTNKYHINIEMIETTWSKKIM